LGISQPSLLAILDQLSLLLDGADQAPPEEFLRQLNDEIHRLDRVLRAETADWAIPDLVVAICRLLVPAYRGVLEQSDLSVIWSLNSCVEALCAVPAAQKALQESDLFAHCLSLIPPGQTEVCDLGPLTVIRQFVKSVFAGPPQTEDDQMALQRVLHTVREMSTQHSEEVAGTILNLIDDRASDEWIHYLLELMAQLTSALIDDEYSPTVRILLQCAQKLVSLD
jgi:hypothetical protein